MTKELSLDDLWNSTQPGDRAFDPARLRSIPNEVRQSLQHAIATGTPLSTAIWLKMQTPDQQTPERRVNYTGAMALTLIRCLISARPADWVLLITTAFAIQTVAESSVFADPEACAKHPKEERERATHSDP